MNQKTVISHNNTNAYAQGNLRVPNQGEALLTRREVASRLGLCQHSVMTLGKRGLLRELKLTRRCVRYRREDVEAFLSEMASR